MVIRAKKAHVARTSPAAPTRAGNGEQGARKNPQPKPREVRRAGWSSADVLRGAALVAGLGVALALFWQARLLLLTAFLGVLLGLAVARGADYLERFRVPRGLSSPALVLAAYAALFGLGALAAPTLGRQLGQIRSRLPAAVDRAEQWMQAHQSGLVGQVLGGGAAAPGGAPPARPAGAAAAPPPAAGKPSTPGAGSAAPQPAGGNPSGRGAAGKAGPARLSAALGRELGAATRYLFPFLSSTIEVLAGLLLITFVAIYFAIDPNVYRQGLLLLVPRQGRERAGEVLSAIGQVLRKWLLTQFIAMLVIGVAMSAVLSLLGVEAALALGIVAGLLEFIPTVGPIVASVPPVAMGFLASPQKALVVAVACLILQQLEGNVVIPLLMKRGVELPPLLTILGQALLAVAFGFLGLVIAVPLIAAIVTAVKMLYVEDVVGEPVAGGTTG